MRKCLNVIMNVCRMSAASRCFTIRCRGALAGTTYPLDREMVARELGFSRVSENSMDSVSDRDFVIEFWEIWL